MHELVGPHRMRHLEAGPTAATVDEHPTAASQAQLRTVVVDVLGPGLRALDRRLHEILRREISLLCEFQTRRVCE
jgi:hypothetical protein